MKQQLGIKSAKEAATIISKLLRDIGFEISAPHLDHFNPNGQHVNLSNERTGKQYHVKFCSEPFYSFGKIFRQYEGQIGETLDAVILENLRDEDTIFFAYPDTIYAIDVDEFRANALSRTNDKDADTHTLSIPMKLLRRFYP